MTDAPGKEPVLPEFAGRDLLRVIVGPPQNGNDVHVARIELYDDGALVRCSWRGPAPEVELADDVGTRYVFDAFGGFGGNRTRRAAFGFVPAVPADARILTACGVAFDLTVANARDEHAHGRADHARPRATAAWRSAGELGDGPVVPRHALVLADHPVDRLRATFLELYDDQALLYWSFSSVEGEELGADALWEAAQHVDGFSVGEEFALTDDLGNRYANLGSGYSFGDERQTMAGYVAFGPGVHRAATGLEVTVRGKRLPGLSLRPR